MYQSYLLDYNSETAEKEELDLFKDNKPCEIIKVEAAPKEDTIIVKKIDKVDKVTKPTKINIGKNNLMDVTGKELKPSQKKQIENQQAKEEMIGYGKTITSKSDPAAGLRKKILGESLIRIKPKKR
jgi:hypothetical protein